MLVKDVQNKNNFAITYGQYGKLWAKKYKDSENAFPSLGEVIEGLLQWMTKKLENNLIGKEKINRKKMIKNYRIVFKQMF